MLKQGIRGIAGFTSWLLKYMARIGIHILKMALAVLEIGLFFAGSVIKILPWHEWK